VLVRPGRVLVRDEWPGTTKHPIERLLPYRAAPDVLLAATNHTIIKAADGTVLASGFGSDDWQETMFSDLSQTKRLVMVNGVDGVWSYDGGSTIAPGIINLSKIDATNPAQLTPTTPADVSKFHVGGTVSIAGATGSVAAANGLHTIVAVGAPAGTFSIDVNLTGATAQTSGPMSATPYGSIQKEPITAPANAPWCNPQNFHVVIHHLNRLYFADPFALAVYYLPLQQKSGTLKQLPLNPVFKHGGAIAAFGSWTLDGGNGMDDKLVVFSTNGEAAIFTGIDPEDTGWNLIGVFQHDHPMSKHCIANYGGDLWVLTSTGLVPMSTLIRAETEKLNKAEKGVITFFREFSLRYPNAVGWSLQFDHSTGRMLCNMPLGSSGGYQQMVRFMPDPVWAKWKDHPSRCWAWMGDKLYFGTDDGKIFEVNDLYTSDSDGVIPLAITAEVRMAWSLYKTAGLKHFKLVRVYGQTNGLPVRPYVDMAVNFLDRRPTNQPEVVQPAPPTMWSHGASGTSTFTKWGSPWSRGRQPMIGWNGVGRLGNSGAPHVLVAVKGASYELAGFDVVYEPGIVV